MAGLDIEHARPVFEGELDGAVDPAQAVVDIP